jgi:hypothetical protein
MFFIKEENDTQRHWPSIPDNACNPGYLAAHSSLAPNPHLLSTRNRGPFCLADVKLINPRTLE